jgi:hypothetical protein
MMGKASVSPITFPFSPEHKTALRALAVEQKLTLADLSRHIHIMYLKDPIAFEKLFFQLCAKSSTPTREKKQ